MERRTLITRFILLLTLGSLAWLVLSVPASSQDFGMAPGMGIGGFSTGVGFYQAPDNDAISDSGLYSFVRYEIQSFEFEIDYGLSDQNFFLGAVDYLYYAPTGKGVTQTEVALGAGVTFINSDPTLDDSKFGPNILCQARFMDLLAVQLRYDFLEGDADLWTFGLSYSL